MRNRRKYKDREKQNDEYRSDANWLADVECAIELGIPANEKSNRCGKRSQQKPRPPLEPHQRNRSNVDGKDISEQEYLMVATGREQQRRREASSHSIGR